MNIPSIYSVLAGFSQLVKMYRGAVNSRDTFLLTAITAEQTEVTVVDAGVLPEPPNLLVIGGNSEDAETVLLLAVDGNTLTIQRGYQGNAKAWDIDNGSGAVIARNFTEADHAAFIHNIKALVDVLPTAEIISFPITQNEYFRAWDLFLCVGGIHAPLDSSWGFTNATLIPISSRVAVDINTNTATVHAAPVFEGHTWEMHEHQSGVYIMPAENFALILKRR